MKSTIVDKTAIGWLINGHCGWTPYTGQYEIGHPQPEFKDLATCPLLVDKTAIAATGVPRSIRFHRSEACFGKPVRPPLSAKTTEASAREAVAEALAVTRNNGAHASDGAGLPWLSRKKLRPSPGKLFRKQRASLTKRPLRLAGLDKVAILQALDKNGLA